MKQLTEIELKIIRETLAVAKESNNFKSPDMQRLISVYGRDVVFNEYKLMKEETQGYYCNICEDTGLVLATDKISKIEFVFKCGECRKAEFNRFKKHVPFYNRMREYYLLHYELDPPL